MISAVPVLEPETFRPLKRAEYDRMVALGLFQDERVELLEGVLVKMSPQDAPHTSTISKLDRLLQRYFADRAEVRVQAPLAVSGESEPEPDIAIVALGDYDTEHPSTAHLVIEVADSSLRRDRKKAALYARAGVPEYWIVNLEKRSVEIYTAPDGDRYAESRTLTTGELRPAGFPDLAIVIADILPRK